MGSGCSVSNPSQTVINLQFCATKTYEHIYYIWLLELESKGRKMTTLINTYIPHDRNKEFEKILVERQGNLFAIQVDNRTTFTIQNERTIPTESHPIHKLLDLVYKSLQHDTFPEKSMIKSLLAGYITTLISN